MRLNDEKRTLIKIGDVIEFTNTDTGEKLRCTVLNLFRYTNFEELYRKHNKVLIGYKENEDADSSDMLDYYSESDIEKYGVVGIEVSII